jgi:hypothetical protein
VNLPEGARGIEHARRRDHAVSDETGRSREETLEPVRDDLQAGRLERGRDRARARAIEKFADATNSDARRRPLAWIS